MNGETSVTRSNSDADDCAVDTRRQGKNLRIVIPGGTGQVGTLLTRSMRRDGHDVVVLTRSAKPKAGEVTWDGKSMDDWVEELNGADAVINLAGYTVNCRYNRKNKTRIMNSRVDSARVIGKALGEIEHPPAVWLQASTATIYTHRFDAPNDEHTGVISTCDPNAPASWNFSIDVASAWEHAMDEASVTRTRTIKLRSAITLSPDEGGAFDILLGLVRVGLGGTAGNGRQFVSWVHSEDFVRAVYWILDRDDLSGIVNIASPNPVPNREFMHCIRKAWGTSVGLPAPSWLLEIGALFMRTETELVLKSRRVIPSRLIESGFTFQFPDWETASQALVDEWRERKAGVVPA